MRHVARLVLAGALGLALAVVVAADATAALNSSECDDCCRSGVCSGTAVGAQMIHCCATAAESSADRTSICCVGASLCTPFHLSKFMPKSFRCLPGQATSGIEGEQEAQSMGGGSKEIKEESHLSLVIGGAGLVLASAGIAGLCFLCGRRAGREELERAPLLANCKAGTGAAHAGHGPCAPGPYACSYACGAPAAAASPHGHAAPAGPGPRRRGVEVDEEAPEEAGAERHASYASPRPRHTGAAPGAAAAEEMALAGTAGFGVGLAVGALGSRLADRDAPRPAHAHRPHRPAPAEELEGAQPPREAPARPPAPGPGALGPAPAPAPAPGLPAAGLEAPAELQASRGALGLEGAATLSAQKPAGAVGPPAVHATAAKGPELDEDEGDEDEDEEDEEEEGDEDEDEDEDAELDDDDRDSDDSGESP